MSKPVTGLCKIRNNLTKTAALNILCKNTFFKLI